jgi:hypothetical protein
MFIQAKKAREASEKVIPAQSISASPARSEGKPAGDIQSGASKAGVGRKHPSPFLISKPGCTTCPPPAEAPIVSDDPSDDQRKRDREGQDCRDLEARRAKNRHSAHQSRLRKRYQLKYLQNQVLKLACENSKLSSSNQDLISQLASVRTENANLRFVQQESMRVTTLLRLAQTGLLDGDNIAPLSFPPF